MSNRYNSVFYVGMTGHLERRIREHKSGFGSRFTSRYRVNKLIYLEAYDDVQQAIHREKQLKGWTRAKKLSLFQAMNPDLQDLAT